MTCCGAKGHLRISPNGLKHFYHAIKSAECGGVPESLEHMELKNFIYQICKSEGWWVQPEYQSPSGDWRADVLAMKDGRKIVFEVQLSIIDLEELKRRESKYRRDGIESYWVLKNFLKFFPDDDTTIVASSNSCIFIDTYINESEFSLYREQLLFVEHGIRSIGLLLQDNCLYTAEILAIDIADWVKSTLRGEYETAFRNFENNYQKKLKLRDIAKPEMKKLCNFSSRCCQYEDEIKNSYAFFKVNEWENRSSMLKGISYLYSTFDSFENAWEKIVSPQNGFVWEDPMDQGQEEPILNLFSETQITSIHDQINNLETEESNFRSVLNYVGEQVEKKRVEKREKLIQLYKEITKKKTLPKNYKILFEFFSELPTPTVESQRGYKYQNFAGLTSEIHIEDAVEFEKKGYGKIVK